MLGTYRLQDPNGWGLQALVHGNRLIQANIRMMDALRELWTSPRTKDALQRLNMRTELVPSDPENTNALECHLLEIDEEDQDSEPLMQETTEETADEHGKRRNVVTIPRKCWLEQILEYKLTSKRARRSATPSTT